MNTPILPEDLNDLEYLQHALITQLLSKGKSGVEFEYSFEEMHNPIFIYQELLKMQSGSYLDKPIF